MDFSRPVKPMENAMIELFNARFGMECLNEGRAITVLVIA